MSTNDLENKFTSTGQKFWRHTKQLQSYLEGSGNTVISTHISPEGRCNLRCDYCSVSQRDDHYQLELSRIKDYVTKLHTRGLKAVIITGGGEPTLYPQFNELIEWLKLEKNLSIGLITNGTQAKRVKNNVWKYFSWIRVSINIFQGFENKIYLPYEQLSSETIVGCSYVVSSKNDISHIHDVAKIATACSAKYVRIIPNCLLSSNSLSLSHKDIELTLQSLNDDRFFRQDKKFSKPNESSCHQSFFRPYLSEVPWRNDGIAGSVYPCDSVVLNDQVAKFDTKYQLCKLEDILDHLDNKIQPQFKPCVDCNNCVFEHNVSILGKFKRNELDKRNEYTMSIKHEEFV